MFPRAYVLGQVVEITLSQVVASYVFYLFFVHKQEVEDRRTVAPYVYKHATRILGDCQAMLAEISRAAGRELDFETASKEDVRAALAAVQTRSPPNMVVDRNMTKATWFQYFMHQRERTLASAKKVLVLGRLIDPRLARRIVDVSDASFLAQMPMLIQYPPSNPTLEVWSGSFWDYLESCRELNATLWLTLERE